MTPYQIIHEVRKYGWLLLMGNGRLHVELPGGHKELLAELKTQKERVRAVLVARENAKKKRKALRLAAPPLVGKPVSIPMACTCRKHPYPHIHGPIDLNDPDDVVVITPFSGEAVWRFLKKQVAIAHEKSKNPVFDDYAFELTQAMPPIVFDGPSVHCERLVESIKPGESIEIMVDRDAVPRPKKTELSPWGKPKIKGYAEYRWDDTSKVSDVSNSWPLAIGVYVTAIERDWILGWIEWRTRAVDYEYVYGRRVRFQEYPSSREGEAHA